jgi:predicted DNA-binding protein (UPF0251 family)
MERTGKVKIAAGAAAAVAVAGGGAAIAASQPWSPKAESQAVIADAAKQLGIDPGKLSDALKQALKDRVDAAVVAGRLTKAQGDELKARIDAADAPFLFGGFGLGPGRFGMLGHPGKLDAAAAYLGLTEEELEAKLERGETLAQVAKDEGKSVDGLVQAMVKDAKTKIDAAVADGRITRAQADQLERELEQRVSDLVQGTYGFGERFRSRPGLGPGWSPWLGPGSRHGGDFRPENLAPGAGPAA